MSDPRVPLDDRDGFRRWLLSERRAKQLPSEAGEVLRVERGYHDSPSHILAFTVGPDKNLLPVLGPPPLAHPDRYTATVRRFFSRTVEPQRTDLTGTMLACLADIGERGEHGVLTSCLPYDRQTLDALVRRGLVRTEKAGKHSLRAYAHMDKAIAVLTTPEARDHFDNRTRAGRPGWLPA